MGSDGCSLGSARLPRPVSDRYFECGCCYRDVLRRSKCRRECGWESFVVSCWLAVTYEFCPKVQRRLCNFGHYHRTLLCVYLAGSTATHELTKTECGWPYVYLYAPPVVTHDGRSAQLTSSRVSNVGGCLFFGRSACVGESD